MRIVTVEEHFLAPMVKAATAALGLQDLGGGGPYSPIAAVLPALEDLEVERLAVMDRAGIDLQVVSHTVPGLEQFDARRAVPLARATNDVLAAAVARHPDRLAAFAALPTAAPRAAAEELHRTVTELSFRGALINGHTGGRFLDQRFFWPIFEMAAQLEVPIYLHPKDPPAAVYSAYYADLSPAAARVLSTGAWGWHVDTGMHVMRMIVSGVFDEFPSLQVIIGHMGECVPFMLGRATDAVAEVGLPRPMTDYVRDNLCFTTSGFVTVPPLLCLLAVVNIDRVMFAVDYPYGDTQRARKFLDEAPLGEADRHKIAHGNAERLLRLYPATA
jgi:predicted TIM-barrel fold metal-dependent hydrolase